MKRTLMMTAAMIFAGGAAFATIDPQHLADSYISSGYTSVEVQKGPTQTKIEAVKGASLVEAIYDNETGDIISQETQPADEEELARTGVDVSTTDSDFADPKAEPTDGDEGDQAGDDGDDGDQAADEGDDGDSGDDGDNGGDGDDGDSGDDGDDGDSGDDGDDGGSGGNDSSGGDCE